MLRTNLLLSAMVVTASVWLGLTLTKGVTPTTIVTSGAVLALGVTAFESSMQDARDDFDV